MDRAVSQASYVAAVAAAQGVMSFTDPSIKVDGKWGSFTQGAYDKQNSAQRAQIDKLVAAVTNGATVNDLRAFRDAERSQGSKARSVSMQLSDKNASIRELVKAIAQEQGVPVATAMKIAHLESRFNPAAKSPTGAAGVFQMTGVAIKDVNEKFKTNYTKQDMYDPVKGITAGLQYMKIVSRYMGIPLTDTVKIYMGFNIGVGSARKVLSGNPELAAKEIAQQAYGKPAVYAANLTNAVNAAPMA